MVVNWRKHLKQMRNGYYEIDGVVGKLISYRFIGSTFILFKLTSRNYEYACEDVPHKLATWRPINDGDKVSYDHIAAEQQAVKIEPEVAVVLPDEVELPAKKPTLPTIDPNQDTLAETLEVTYKATIASIVQSTNFANEELRKVILRLKGTNGKDFVGAAKQIVNATNATRNNTNTAIDFFKTGISLMKELQKSKQNPNSDAQGSNDRQKD